MSGGQWIVGGGVLAGVRTYGNDCLEDAEVDSYNDVGVRGKVVYNINRTWSGFGSLALHSAGDGDADFADTVVFDTVFGAMHRYREGLSFVYGLRLQTRHEGDAIIHPIVGIDWQITDKWRFALFDREDRVTRGTYQLTPEWAVGARADVEIKDYRLDDEKVTDKDSAVLRDTSLSVGVEASWTPNDQTLVRPYLAMVAYRELAIEDEDENDIVDKELDATVRIGLSGSWQF
ncbi:MAG: DUF6268 family outer membrane beta-barrel protein [Planctomycetota bacterium]